MAPRECFSRNAVLPQFMTWKIQVETDDTGFKFPSPSLVYCHQDKMFPLFKGIDQKTILAVTNVAGNARGIVTGIAEFAQIRPLRCQGTAKFSTPDKIR